MTHDELVDRAGRWLLNTKRCKWAATHRQPWSTSEHPDAIGWFPDGSSVVIECKVSEVDLRADRYKSWRKTSKGMGFYRYYMTTADITEAVLIPPGSGWLVCKGRTVKVMREAEPRPERDATSEISFLVAQLDTGRTELPESTDAQEGKDDG